MNWYSDNVRLYYPSPVQCEEVINKLDHSHKTISLEFLSTHSTLFLLASPQFSSITLRTLDIAYTPLPNDCIQYLCQLLTVNKSIQELVINYCSVIVELQESVKHFNKTLHLLHYAFIIIYSLLLLVHSLFTTSSSITQYYLYWI